MYSQKILLLGVFQSLSGFSFSAGCLQKSYAMGINGRVKQGQNGQKYTPNSNSRTRESRTTAAAQQDLQAPKAGAEWSKTTPKDEQQKQERAEQQQQHSRTSKHSRQGQKGQKLPPKTAPTTTAPRFITIKAD